MVELEYRRMPLYCSAEGMRQLEEMKKQPPTEEEKMLFDERERGGVFDGDMRASGFGKAAEGVDWVSDRQKPIY